MLLGIEDSQESVDFDFDNKGPGDINGEMKCGPLIKEEQKHLGNLVV